MLDQEIRVTSLGFGQVLNTDFEIILPQPVMQVAGTQKKIKQVESGNQPDFLGIYFSGH